jgi:Tfp pilus assembly protein PilX
VFFHHCGRRFCGGLRSLLARGREEVGIALVMALGVMLSLGIAGSGIAYYVTSNQKSAYSDDAGTRAFHYAEEGLNRAYSRLSYQLNASAAVKTTFIDGMDGTDPRSPTLLSDPSGTTTCKANGNTNSTYKYYTVSYSDGSVSYCGINTGDTGDPKTEYTWKLMSVGVAKSGKTTRTRTLTQDVQVRGITGSDILSWSRFYQDSTATCLTIDTIDMPAPVATRGDLCLKNGGTITGTSNTIDVGGNVKITGVGTNAGYKSPTAASGWTSSSSVYASDSVFATNSIAQGSTGAVLVVTGFNVSVPSTAIVQGIQVEIERKSSSSSTIRDTDVYLQKTSAAVGTDHSSTSYWPTTKATATYGTASDLWGTTWTPSEINASTFGVRITARNSGNTYGGGSQTASIDRVRIIVTYSGTPTTAVGSAASPISDATIGGNCQLNNAPAHAACDGNDAVWASTVTKTALADNTELSMPQVDLDYWFDNAKPGPKHPCTNSPTNMGSLVFDNDGSTTSNNSFHYNDGTTDMAPTNSDYTCEFWQDGVKVGELSWNHTTHVLKIGGTIFFDGDVRFDQDGHVVHYQGRAMIYAAGNVEFDSVVCAGGSGTSSCLSDMTNWDPSANLLILLSGGDSEYDQGGTTCSPSGTINCPNGYVASGLQGVVSAQGTCTIHQEFRLSGPVVCNTLSLPKDTSGWPNYYQFPSLGGMVDGLMYVDTSTATRFTFQKGSVSG